MQRARRRSSPEKLAGGGRPAAATIGPGASATNRRGKRMNRRLKGARKPEAATASSPEHLAGGGDEIKLGQREGARTEGIGPEAKQSRHGERLKRSPATMTAASRRPEARDRARPEAESSSRSAIGSKERSNQGWGRVVRTAAALRRRGRRRRAGGRRTHRTIAGWSGRGEARARVRGERA